MYTNSIQTSGILTMCCICGGRELPVIFQIAEYNLSFGLFTHVPAYLIELEHSKAIVPFGSVGRNIQVS